MNKDIPEQIMHTRKSFYLKVQNVILEHILSLQSYAW